MIRQYIQENKSWLEKETIVYYYEVAGFIEHECRKPKARRRTVREFLSIVFEMMNEPEKFAERIGAASFEHQIV